MDRSNDNPQPVLVKVNNFPSSPRPRKTTTLTYVLDPAATDMSKRWAQICDYEPTRYRLVIHVLDAPCILLVDETPRALPDVTSAGVAPAQGRVLPNQALEYVFFGQDAMYLNSVSAAVAGRVTVTKEYM
jgi:hypothetical protein